MVSLAARSRSAAVLLAVALSAGTATLLSPGTAQAATRPAQAFDLNGDGYAELVVGVPNETVGVVRHTGAVSILNGSAAGVAATRSTLLDQNTAGVIGGNEVDDTFGRAVASADFDSDGFADLAVSAPGENGADPNDLHGAVHVLYGTAHGVDGARDQRLTPANLGTKNLRGDPLVTGDLNGDGYADLVLSSGSWLGDYYAHWSLSVVYGSATGLDLRTVTHLSGAQSGVPAAAAATSDYFGKSVVVGDLSGDGVGELVVGTRQNNSTGAVFVFPSTRTGGVSATASSYLPQTDPALLAATETEFNDTGLFGYALAVGYFDGDGYLDVATSDPQAGPPGFAGCSRRSECPGAVVVLPGSATGLVPANAHVWSQQRTGVAGESQPGDGYGSALASGDLNGDRNSDLAVGIVGKDLDTDLGENHSEGAAGVLYGGVNGLSGSGSQEWSQRTPGVTGAYRTDDGFGGYLRIAQMGKTATADLAVSVIGKDSGTVDDSGAVVVLYSGTGGLTATGSQQWSQSSPGVAGEPGLEDYYGMMGGF
jgi:hypothetical protein